MKKQYGICCFVAVVVATFSLATAAERVVVIPLGGGGATGNATSADVVKGKTFSSTAGKGLTGTLEQHPMAQTFITPSYSMIFNLIPAGTFTMGSPENEPGRDDNEVPQVVTTLSQPLYVQISEVTQQQWSAVVLAAEAGQHISVDELADDPSLFSGKPSNPVEQVSYEDVQSWIALLNTLDGRAGCDGTYIHEACYRLPTEAEWEYAARAGTTTAYANPYNYDIPVPPATPEIGTGFNPNLAAMGWYNWNDSNHVYPTGTKPVARKMANSWGLYDMHGNVWEWCRDWYAAEYYSSPERPSTDPEGPARFYRVIRGGDWDFSASDARSAKRHYWQPDSSGSFLGFRLVLPPGQ